MGTKKTLEQNTTIRLELASVPHSDTVWPVADTDDILKSRDITKNHTNSGASQLSVSMASVGNKMCRMPWACGCPGSTQWQPWCTDEKSAMNPWCQSEGNCHGSCQGLWC